MPEQPDPDVSLRDAQWYKDAVTEVVRTGDLAAALALCEEGLSQWQRNERLWQTRLALLRKMGRVDDALAVANDRSDLSAKARATGYFQLLAFETCLEAGQVDAARDRLSQLAELVGDGGPAHLSAQVAWARAMGEAAQVLPRILPHMSGHLGNEGLVLAVAALAGEAGQGAQAVELLTKAVRAHPSARTLGELARLIEAEGDGEKAARVLDDHRLLMLGSRGLLLQRLRLAVRLDVYDGMADLAAQGGLAFPEDKVLWRLYWQVLAGSQGEEEALQAAERIGADRSRPIAARLTAVEHQFSAGAVQTGLTLLRQMVDEAPQDAALVLRLARAEMDQGFDPSAGLQVLEQARARGVTGAGLSQMRGFALARLGFLGDATAELSGLHRAGELDRNGEMRLAEFHTGLGAFEAAQAVLDGLEAKTDQARANICQTRAGIARAMGDLAMARDLLEAAIDLGGPVRGRLSALAEVQLLAGAYGAAWATHLRDIDSRAKPAGSGLSLQKPRRSLLGQILNEVRIYYGDRDGFGPRWDSGGSDAVRYFRQETEADPGSTPAAIALMGALRRDGAIPDVAPGATDGPDGPLRIPKRIGQFWDARAVPEQVVGLMDWNQEMNPDYEIQRFSGPDALAYLLDKDETQAARAFRITRQAAGKADLFRLVWLWHEGGVWLDADDRCVTPLSEVLDHRWRFIGYQERFWTLGNNFIAVAPGDPIIRAALDEAAETLCASAAASIWLSSGPGALTRAMARHGTHADGRLVDGIRILPAHALAPHLGMHVRLNYKGTDSHWIRELKQVGT